MRKLLEYLYIVQKKTFVKEHNGKVIDQLTKRRLNPYNPLTYIAIPIYYVVAIVMFGFVGYKENTDSNFFKWQ